MPVQLVRRTTTSREFRDWQRYFLQRSRKHQREDFYLAQIALEVRRVLHSNPKSLRLQHFLLKFNSGTETSAKTKTEADQQERTDRSKAAWCGMLGLKVPKGPK